MKEKIKFIRSLIYEIFYSINIFQNNNPLTKKILASRKEYEILHKTLYMSHDPNYVNYKN